LALETYRAQNDAFPLPTCGGTDGTDLVATDSSCPGEYIDGLVPVFTAALPMSDDSGNTLCDIEYRTDAIGSWYKLTAINCLAGVDATTGIGSQEPLARCPQSCESSPVPLCAGVTYNPAYVASAPHYESFAVYSLGGQCK
jgi:hypothetical protein